MKYFGPIIAESIFIPEHFFVGDNYKSTVARDIENEISHLKKRIIENNPDFEYWKQTQDQKILVPQEIQYSDEADWTCVGRGRVIMIWFNKIKKKKEVAPTAEEKLALAETALMDALNNLPKDGDSYEYISKTLKKIKCNS